jgi:hypothetical protein
VRKATANGVRDAMKDYLPRMVMALDGRGNSAFSGDNVAQNPAKVLDALENLAPASPTPPAGA